MRISDWSSDVCSSDLAAFCICKSTSSADQSVPCVYNAEAVPAGPPRRRRLPRRLVMHPVHPQPMERPGTLRSWEGRMSASATAARKLRGIALKVAQACLLNGRVEGTDYVAGNIHGAAGAPLRVSLPAANAGPCTDPP